MPVVFEKEMGKGTEGCGLFRYSLRQDCKFIIILSQYIIFSSGQYTFRASSRFLPLPPHPPKAHFIHSTWSQNTENKKTIGNVMWEQVKMPDRHTFWVAVAFWLLPSSPKTIAFIPRGAKTQKIKRIDHRKCNVRASKNADQAFSAQWYLYISYGLFFLFSSVPLMNQIGIKYFSCFF